LNLAVKLAKNEVLSYSHESFHSFQIITKIEEIRS